MSGTTTCGPDARARRNWYRVTAVNDDALQSCPCTGGRHPRPQGRARRRRRVERARASRVRHRPAVAPQPATLSQVAGRGGDRGSAGRPARRHRHRAVSAALGRRPSLFHRGRAPHGWTWGGSDAARGRRSGRGRARLPRHPPRSAHDQPRRDLALPQERLPAIRSSSRLLRGRRRCAAFRETARPQLARARGRAALFSPDHRIHLRAGLHHDGAGLGRSKVQAGGRLRISALARSHHHLHDLGTGRLRALRDGGCAQAPRPRARGLCQPPRALFSRHGELRRQAPRHARDTTPLPARHEGARYPKPPNSCERIGSHAGIRCGERGHRRGFVLSHGPQREAALDFCLRSRRTACSHARPGGHQRRSRDGGRRRDLRGTVDRVRARDPSGSRAAERGHRHPERIFMTGWVILVDQPKDLPNAETPHKVITTSEYLARPRLFDMGRPKLVNLARSYAYQSKGYYASLLAEARGHRVMPTVETMLELREAKLYEHALPKLEDELNRCARRADFQPEGEFKLLVCFGIARDPRFESFGRLLFDWFRCPALGVNVESGAWLSIERIRPRNITRLANAEASFLRESLHQPTKREWRDPKARTAPKYDLAVLYDPNEKMAPSSPASIKYMARIAERLSVDVEPVTRRQLSEITEYDGLFIHETTSI